MVTVTIHRDAFYEGIVMRGLGWGTWADLARELTYVALTPEGWTAVWGFVAQKDLPGLKAYLGALYPREFSGQTQEQVDRGIVDYYRAKEARYHEACEA